MPDATPAPAPLRRVSYHDAAHAAAPQKKGDPGYAGSVAAAAIQLPPLQAMQTAFDQLNRAARDRASGAPWEHTGSFAGHTADVLKHAGRLRDVLATAHAAADAMIADMTAQTSSLEKSMSKPKSDAPDHPQLTTTGEPHPLEKGGYDADSDPGLPGNISDVEALKEGKTTRAQAAAIGEADAQDAKDDEAEKKAAEKKAAAPKKK
jgi:hypothetical protein